MVFQRSLRDSKSPQVSRILLSILAVLNNALIWMVSTRPPTSKSSSPFYSTLATAPKAPITIGIIVTFMFHTFFFQFPSKVEVLILLFTFFQFYSVVIRDSKVDNFASLSFFCGLFLSLVFWPRLGDPCVCQSPIGVFACHSLWTDAGSCIYHWLVCSNLKFLHISLWTTLPTQSFLV